MNLAVFRSFLQPSNTQCSDVLYIILIIYTTSKFIIKTFHVHIDLSGIKCSIDSLNEIKFPNKAKNINIRFSDYFLKKRANTSFCSSLKISYR